MKVIRLERSGESQYNAVEDEIDELDIAIQELRDARRKLDRAQLHFDQLQEAVVEMMDSRAEKSHFSPLENGWQATVVHGETVVYDEPAILEAVQEPLRHLITDEKINRKKLEAEVLRGTIDAHLVAEHATVKPRKPFVRLTEHREQEPEEPS